MKICLGLAFAEGFRRLVMMFVNAFTGPFAKVPGPLWARFTILPWMIDVLRGKQHYRGERMLAKYGNVVRTGKSDS